ncbi:hypothetical protein ATANTOWER_024636 [Ataeniobius toweri]|uniref:Uncharacterized protein n=1 Tax=Ataeniobius toweri TaxID=208326 RepID=A0ABU7BA97_9TELE|nr:hypothetical protein [Ataeniobius toweri]
MAAHTEPGSATVLEFSGVLGDSWQFSCYLRLLDQAVSVPCPPSNVNICTPNSFLFLLRAHTEQHLENLLQTWILNASSPGDLTTPIYWKIIRS